MSPKLLKIRRVEHLKLLRLSLWGWRSPTLWSAEVQQRTEPDPIELEQAFNGAYRSYRINGRPRMDVETFFHRIRGDLIDLIKRELNGLNSARVQTTTWIRFIREDEEGQERVELALTA